MRVAVDVTSLLTPLTGVGQVVRALVDGLAVHPDVELTLFPVSVRGRERMASVTPAGARSVAVPLPARALRKLWQHVDHPRIDPVLGRPRPDVVHGPNFVVPPSGAARVVTVHDLTPLHFPELAHRDTHAYPRLIRRAATAGALIHTVSHAVRDEVVAELGIDADRVIAVPNGIDPRVGDAAAGRDAAGVERYLIAVGTVEPRKDLAGLVAAFDEVAATDLDLHLVHAGGDGWGVEQWDAAVAGAHHGDRIRRLGRVDDRTRTDLLAGAIALVYPSVYEGFGLVPLEAMATGTPVVTTDVPAIREVCGDAAILVPVGDHDALTAAIGQVLGGLDRTDPMIRAGHERVALHPWSATVEGVVDIYRRAASGP